MKTIEETTRLLQEKLTHITSELEQIAHFHSETGDWEAIPDQSTAQEADDNSEADAFEEHEKRQSMVSELEITYRNTTRALEKIKVGTYGLCEICSEPIAPERLTFLPTARTCTTHLDDERSLSL